MQCLGCVVWTCLQDAGCNGWDVFVSLFLWGTVAPASAAHCRARRASRPSPHGVRWQAVRLQGRHRQPERPLDPSAAPMARHRTRALCARAKAASVSNASCSSPAKTLGLFSWGGQTSLSMARTALHTLRARWGHLGSNYFFVVRTQGLQYAACHGERSSVDQRNTKTAQYMTRSPWHIRFATDQTIRKCFFACRHLGMNDNLKPASLRKMRVPRTYRSPIMVFQPARKQQLLLPQAKKHFRNLLPTQGAMR